MYDKQGLLFPQLPHSEVVTNVGFEIKKKKVKIKIQKVFLIHTK